ncbi:MAG: glycosyltransferase [Alphaproteobacteria bacterium]|nr:glycosyltransferase [Alphaproteobacteria bacterium]
MKKLAIISSYNELCGNATYSYALKNAFSEFVDVEVIPLDLFLLQKIGHVYEVLGDKHIQEIADRLSKFDYVNIQFEAGLYGRTQRLAYKRVRMLIEASNNLIVTMHRVDMPEMSDWELVGEVLGRRMWPTEAWMAHERGRNAKLYERIVKLCKARSESYNTWIFVHRMRDRRIIKEMYNFDNVVCFPLAFLRADQRQAILQANNPLEFRRKYHVPDGVKVMGAFGFVTRYKGFETLVSALRVLPEDHHLYIFGGQHPQSITSNTLIHPYIGKLLKQIGTGLAHRVHFVGALSDDDFIEALHFCDYTVMPYLEVGLGMSGVITLAMESGANLFCTLNHSFNDVRKLMGNVFHTFDIGNYMELAEKMRIAEHAHIVFGEQRERAYQEFNIRKNVLKHLEALGHFK